MLYPYELLGIVQQLAGFGITTLDLRTGVTTWSDELFRIYGWDPGAVTPSLDTLLQRVYPADVKAVRAMAERSHKVQPTAPLEYRILRGEGELRTLQTRVRRFHDDAGVPSRLVCTTIDITEHKDTAARLVFTDRMASVGNLAAGVAHEINNPLAIVSAHLELITQELDDPLPGDLEAMLEETRRGVARIRDIVHGLAAFSSTDEEPRNPLEIERVLDLAVQMATNQIRHRAQLVRAYSPLPSVMANQATLAQVFLNLLVNACEAIPEGHTELHTISISTRTDGAGWAIIEIADTGRGIAREIQGRLFDPFFTTKPIGKGTGLGLSMSLGIVRALGGELGFTSEPDRGAVFRVAIPPAIAAARAPVPDPTPTVTTAVRPRTRVLIIDDEVVFASALRRLLARDEHQITIVHDGREAIARAEAGERFDAIVCDLMMPAMSGMEVHAQLLATAPELADRMVFLTGGAFSASAKQFLQALVNPWFEKPCDFQALRSVILRIAQNAK